MKQSKPNKTATVQLRDIRANGATQMRAGIDDEHLERLIHAIDEGVELPPIDVFEDDRNIMWLADGFHRWHAYRKRGVAKVKANIWYGTKQDAVVFAAGANADHGLPRTREDKRRAVKALLNDPDWKLKSGREIASQARVSESFVRTVIGEVSGNGAERNALKAHQSTKSTGSTESHTPTNRKPDSIDPAKQRIQTRADRGPTPEDREPAPAQPAAETQEGEPVEPGVPESATEALQTKSQALSLKIAFSKLFDQYLEMCRGPGGNWYSGYRPDIESNIEQVKGAIDAATPHGICPYCEGDGCERCRLTGVMPKVVHQNAMNVLKRFAGAKT